MYDILAVTKKDNGSSSLTFRPGVKVSCKPEMDGNCQFSAVAYLLQSQINITLSSSDLRQRVVKYLSTEPRLTDGTKLDLSNFVDGGDVNGYLIAMSSERTFDDHLTLLGMACLFQIQFVVLSSLGECGTRTISPHTNSSIVPNLPVLLLGYFAETQLISGEHYVSLEPENPAILQSII